jgi:hypothetical protein
MKFFTFLFILFISYECTTAQNSFLQTVDDTTQVGETTYFTNIVAAPGGNFFVISGSALIMIDSSGHMLWNKYFSGNTFTNVFPLTDGCYLIGKTNSPEKGLFLRINIQGEVLESYTISSETSPITLRWVIPQSNGDKLIVADFAFKNIYFIKMDSIGKMTPLSHYTFEDDVEIYDMVGDSLGGYLLGTQQYGSTANAIIARVNASGIINWAKKIKLAGNNYNNFRAGTLNADRSINAVFDSRPDLLTNKSKICLNRIDSNANFLLKKMFEQMGTGEEIEATDISASADKHLSICCTTDVQDTMLVLRYDENFNPIWAISFGAGYYIRPQSIAATHGNNLLVAEFYQPTFQTNGGTIRKISSGGDGCNVVEYFMKEKEYEMIVLDLNNYSTQAFDSVIVNPISIVVSSPFVSYLGCDTVTSVENVSTTTQQHPFPNPFTNTIHLKLNSTTVINVYDVFGRLVESYDNVSNEFSVGEKWLPGIYFIEITNNFGKQKAFKTVKTR